MPRSRPVLYAAAGLLLLAWAAGRPARGDNDAPASAAPTDPVRVHVEKAGGGSVEGELLDRTLPVETGYGTVALNVAKLRTLTLARNDAGGVTANATMDDKSTLHGTPQFAAVRVRTADGEVALSPADVREVRFLRPKNLSVTAIVLGLVTLAAMEIVLGVDNIIFLAILAGRLPREQQARARRIGLAAALGTRIVLLFTLSWLLGLTKPLFTLPDLPLLSSLESREVSGRDLILLLGGAFLIYKSVREMHHKLEEARDDRDGEDDGRPGKPVSFAKTIATIAVVDIVFSLDSVITAVGMVDELWVMVTAMVIAMLVMLVSAGPVAAFVDRHPTIKMLALSFLILIGVLLVAESLGQHIDKGYIYFAMAFGVAVEVVNMRLRPKPLVENPAEATTG